MEVTFPAGAGPSTGTQTVHVANQSAGPVTIGGISIEGRDAGAFRAGGDCRGKTIAPYDGCVVDVGLAAAGGGQGGRRDATLVIAYMGARSPQRVTLRAGP